jgi:predicted regulator of Ras-like GTPase activity (Roadblock/LC7/MglB family)
VVRAVYATFKHFKEWQMDSLALGKYFLPVLQKLASRLPNTSCVLLCTADGFNVCSLGLTEAQVGKMAALGSSLMSVAAATVSSVLTDETEASRFNLLTMNTGDLQLVCTKVTRRQGGNLILLVGARTTLGGTLVCVKTAIDELSKLS